MIYAFAFAGIAIILASNFFKNEIRLWFIIGAITFAITAVAVYFELEILFMIVVGILVLALIVALLKKHLE
jgi:hypothetical protein